MAPLKQVHNGVKRLPSGTLHDRKVMAPLKHEFKRCLLHDRQDSLHDRKVMAPLKRRDAVMGPYIVRPLHDRKVMAPLKHGEAFQLRLPSSPLHDRKVMAPLKLQGQRPVSVDTLLSMTARSWPH